MIREMIGVDVFYGCWSHWDRMTLNHFYSAGLILCVCKMGTRNWTLWFLRVLLALMFSGSLCFSVSSLCPLVVPSPPSLHPCLLSNSFPTLYHGNFSMICSQRLAWAAGMGRQRFSCWFPNWEKQSFAAITSWRLSVFWLVQQPQASWEIANPGHSSSFLEWCW